VKRRRFIKLIPIFGALALIPTQNYIAPINILINRLFAYQVKEKKSLMKEDGGALEHHKYPRQMRRLIAEIEMSKYERLIDRYERDLSINTYIEIARNLIRDFDITVCIDAPREEIPYILRDVVTDCIKIKYGVHVEPGIYRCFVKRRYRVS
jgi:hypothetical protein